MEYKDYILEALYESVEEQLKEPRLGLTKKRFMTRSYIKWAVKEIFDRLSDPSVVTEYDMMLALEHFIALTNRWSRKAKRKEAALIFETAQTVGDWIYDLLTAMVGY